LLRAELSVVADSVRPPLAVEVLLAAL